MPLVSPLPSSHEMKAGQRRARKLRTSSHPSPRAEQAQFGPEKFTVIAFPCNQFGAQEPVILPTTTTLHQSPPLPFGHLPSLIRTPARATPPMA